jgi:hypothetical protein
MVMAQVSSADSMLNVLHGTSGTPPVMQCSCIIMWTCMMHCVLQLRIAFRLSISPDIQGKLCWLKSLQFSGMCST